MKKMILASTSTVFGSKYLEYLFPVIKNLYQSCNNIIFIPFARPNGISHDLYTKHVKTTFNKIGLNISGINESNNSIDSIKKCDGIFIGGGNSFVLLDEIQKNNLLIPLKNKIESGTPFLGTSAGSNICGISIGTTNDMPIVYPTSLNGLSLIPFNINPHYIDPITGSKHMGESRETRIKEFHKFNNQLVVGLKEGSYLEIIENNIILKGSYSAKIFKKNQDPFEIDPSFNLNKLLN